MVWYDILLDCFGILSAGYDVAAAFNKREGRHARDRFDGAGLEDISDDVMARLESEPLGTLDYDAF